MTPTTDNAAFTADLIRGSLRSIATGAVERQVALQPDVLEKYGSLGFVDLRGDTELRLENLAAAIAVGHSDLFSADAEWLKVAMTARDVPIDYLAANYVCISDELAATLPKDLVEMPRSYLERARSALQSAPNSIPSHLESGPHVEIARRYLLAVLETRDRDAVRLVVDAFEAGVSAPDIYEHVIARTQAEIGRMWQMGEAYVAEEHLASQIAARSMAALYERAECEPTHGGRVLCTSVGADLHDLGIRAVSHHLEWAGWKSVLLGSSMPAHDLVLAIDDFEIDLVALSANLALHVPSLLELIAATHTVRRPVKILVGGRPFQLAKGLWKTIGADAHARNAREAVTVARGLLPDRADQG